MHRSSVHPQLDHLSPTPTPPPGRQRAPNALIKVSSTETQFPEVYTYSRQVAEKKAFPSKLFVVVLKFVLIRLPFSSSSRRKLSKPFVFNNIFIFNFLLFIFNFIFVFNYNSSSWRGSPSTSFCEHASIPPGPPPEKWSPGGIRTHDRPSAIPGHTLYHLSYQDS